ncbi:MAG: hypothetical protein D6823_09145, partial [Chloroflexi bacterium]
TTPNAKQTGDTIVVPRDPPHKMGHRSIPATENEQFGNVSGVMKILNPTALELTLYYVSCNELI